MHAAFSKYPLGSIGKFCELLVPRVFRHVVLILEDPKSEVERHCTSRRTLLYFGEEQENPGVKTARMEKEAMAPARTGCFWLQEIM